MEKGDSSIRRLKILEMILPASLKKMSENKRLSMMNSPSKMVAIFWGKLQETKDGLGGCASLRVNGRKVDRQKIS